jgi:hypothetical protein
MKYDLMRSALPIVRRKRKAESCHIYAMVFHVALSKVSSFVYTSKLAETV